MKYILASKSPRRSEILSNLGLDFEVIVSDCEEFCNKTNPADIVQELAKIKAIAVNAKVNSKEAYTIIAADTIVVHNNKIFGKPQTKDEAYSMLKKLNNNWHTVYTGICLITANPEIKLTTYNESTKVHMKEMSDEQIWEYIESGEPMDKAGAYGIQSKNFNLVDKISGEYETVVGLPIKRLKEELSITQE